MHVLTFSESCGKGSLLFEIFPKKLVVGGGHRGPRVSKEKEKDVAMHLS